MGALSPLPSPLRLGDRAGAFLGVIGEASMRLRGVVIWVVALSLAIAPALLGLLRGQFDLGSSSSEIVSSLAFLLVGPIYAITSAVIVSRQPTNPVGWMLMLVSAGMTVGLLSDILAPEQPPSHLGPGLLLLLGLASVSWVFFIFPIFHLVLTFPDGRLLSPVWRVFVSLEILMVGFMLFAAAFTERVGPPDESWTVANPVGFLPASVFGPAFFFWWNGGLLVLTVACVVSIVLRYARSSGVVRQQIKWLLFAVAVFAVVYGGAAVVAEPEVSGLLGALLPIAVMGIGLAIAIAVLRYRLFEIDRIISRTVTYTIVVALLASTVAAISAVVGAQFQQPVVVAATTLGVAALFNPLRRRVQVVVDRRFNRSRYDGERVMGEFSSSLRDRVDPDGLVDGWVHVVSDTMQPAALGVWVRTQGSQIGGSPSRPRNGPVPAMGHNRWGKE